MDRRKLLFTGFFLILSVLLNQHSSGYKFEFITVSDIVKKVKQRFAEIDSYQANFRIVSEKLGKKDHQSGTVKYRSSDKLLVEFHHPYGQKIVSDGKMMWIYIPSMNVVAEQDLKSDSSSIFSSGTGSGLRRLFSKYHYRFASKEQPEPQSDGKKMYTLFLKQKESKSGFRTLKLWISEDYIISKAYGETSSGKKIEIQFDDIRTNVNLPLGIFRFDIPSRARVIKNPMISEEK
jgi:outer membrane lipoprotein carrier protein